MIPLHLFLSGFLSYRDPATIDFTPIELACIAGANGAGKSSILDAITWALFGQARKRDDSLINARSSVAEVRLIFSYEGNIYRVLRAKPRDKTALLEFHIYQAPVEDFRVELIDQPGAWKALTERSLRETEALIAHTLRLDYETFVNASFFLQGKADQFTQQRPSDRKRILSSILGLDAWDDFRERAGERRKAIENQIVALEGRLHEIDAELGEEETRRARLAELEKEMERLAQARQTQEGALDNLRQVAATLAEQGKLVALLARQVEDASRRLADLEARLQIRLTERGAFAQVLARQDEIETTYAAWQARRARLEEWEAIAGRFREHEKRRQEPLDELNAARARLEQECQHLEAQRKEVETSQAQAGQLQAQLVEARRTAGEAEAQVTRRIQLDIDLQEARQRLAEARAENPRLKAEMDDLKTRIDRLTQIEGVNCPLCGQPLSPQDRQALIAAMTVQGKEMGDRYRANRNLLDQADQLVRGLEGEMQSLGDVEQQLRLHNQAIAQLEARLAALESQNQAWETQLAPRLVEAARLLDGVGYAPEARARLAEIDSELKAIGYDAAAHDADRRAELEGRAVEGELRSLEQARAALAPVEREIADLQKEAASRREEVERQRGEHERAVQALEQTQAPDVEAAEIQLLSLQEQENRLRMEVGAARQKVLVLDDLKNRRQALNVERDGLKNQVGHYRQLERAFGKDGVPALLIEQALPQIESKANEVLDRLSQGTMAVRFVTQAAYKDKHREDLKETLDIQISDGAGSRDYEMFSGGEAFRVNFAIRLALSEVLAQRAGARLQTLVIDEGFGSQDAQGRQRLVEAINLVHQDFARILVITHIDELKDAFPTRIEVEKTARGSQVRVL
jgi:exonuclease SbcC